jgi:hypothetical protein
MTMFQSVKDPDGYSFVGINYGVDGKRGPAKPKPNPAASLVR